MNTTETIIQQSITYPTLAELQKTLAAQPKVFVPDGTNRSAALLQHVNWPSKSQPQQMDAFYGPIELSPCGLPSPRWVDSKLVDMTVPFPMRWAHQQDFIINAVRVHREVKPSLARIFEAIWEEAGRSTATIRDWNMDLFGGTYGYAFDRFGELEMTAYGAAISFNPLLRRYHKKGRPPKDAETPRQLPSDVIAFFLTEGWKYDRQTNGFEAANP